MGMFDFVGKAVGSVTKGFGAGAPQNNYQATPYAYDPKSFQQNANNDQVSQEQMDFIKSLMASSSNPNQSVGMAQSNMQRDANVSANNALANSSVGTNPALAFREAQVQNNLANQKASQQGLITALQERNANYNALNGAFNGSLSNSNVQEANQIKLAEDRAAENRRVDEINSGIAKDNLAARNQQAGAIYGGLIAGSKMVNGSLPTDGLGGGSTPSGSTGIDTGGEVDGGGGGSSVGGGLMGAYKGGIIPSPQKFDNGGLVQTAMKFAPLLMALLNKGGEVPGEAPVKGDSPKNDQVPAVLSPGEVVIPRHVMESNDPAKGAKDFVEALLKQASLKKDNRGYGAVLQAHAELGRQLKMCAGGRV